MKIQTFTCLALIGFIAASCSSYYTEDDFHEVKKYDAHIHIRTTHDAVADQAAADFFQLVNVSVAHNDSSLRAQDLFAIHQVAAHPRRIRYLTAFSMEEWDSADWVDETIKRLQESFAQGAIGIKIWKNIGMVEKTRPEILS